MLDFEKIDAASICVPISLHKDVSIACIEQGIEILLEKPIADAIESAKAIIDKSEDKKVTVCIGHI